MQEKNELQKKKNHLQETGVSECFWRSQQTPSKVWKYGPNTKSFSLIERIVHNTLSVYKQIYDEKNKQTKQTTMDTFLKSLKQIIKKVPKRGHCYNRRWLLHVYCATHKKISVGQEGEVEDNSDSDPM